MEEGTRNLDDGTEITSSDQSRQIDGDGAATGEESPRRYLERILARSTDFITVDGILKAFGMRKAKRVASLERVKAQANFRVEEIGEIHYILCQVPDFYDPERHMECGFAVDVDQDHFDVLPYMKDRRTGESKVFGELPHCVHMALNVRGNDYTRVSDRLKESVNEDSAIFFINHLLGDLAMGCNAPVEIFENKLYLQLVNRLVETGDDRWCNGKLVEQKLVQLVKQIESLNTADPFYENNLRRVGVYLSQFLFGYEDSVEAYGFFNQVSPEVIKKYAAAMYRGVLSKEFLRQSIEHEAFLRDAQDLLEKSGIEPPSEIVQEALSYVLSSEWLEGVGDSGDLYDAHDLAKAFEASPSKATIEGAYRDYLERRKLGWLEGLYAWVGNPPPPDVVEGWHGILCTELSPGEADEWRAQIVQTRPP